MENTILVRFGDLMLKGANKKRFIKALRQSVKEKVSHPKISFEHAHDRLYIHLGGADVETITKMLKRVSGIDSFSVVTETNQDLENIKSITLNHLKAKVNRPMTFKVTTKRADKTFPISSMEISKQIAGICLKAYPELTVDLSNPELNLTIEIRKRGTYIYSEKIPGMGGFPSGIAGKGILLLSGGIDSPVAGYLAMKQGIDIEAMHFESTPLTSIESAQKAIDLCKPMAVYNHKSRIKLHMIPFKDIHQAIIEMVPEPYLITIMRRMMVRIADRFAKRDHTPILISGESIGQVASQTLESIKVTSDATSIPIIRPLATTDKNTIIDLARTINTYDISVRPFEDCCSIYTPKKPATNPRIYYALRYERLFDYETLIEEALQNIKTITVTEDTTIDVTTLGLTIEEALKESGENHDYERPKPKS